MRGTRVMTIERNGTVTVEDVQLSVARDYACEACGSVTRNMIGDVIQWLPCDVCRCVTSHRDICNGARNSRFHWNDWGTVPLEALATFDGAGAACASDGRGGADISKPVRDVHTGEVYHDRAKYQAEARAEKSARRKHAAAKRKGLGRVYGPTSGLKKASNGN